MVRLSVRSVATALALPLALAACSAKKEPPPCPPIYILSDAKEVTKYRPGAGRDLTDMDVQAEIVGFNGACTYKPRGEDWNVELELQVAIEAKRGPGNTTRKADLTYFVALPAFFPQTQAKAVFPITVEFPEGTSSARHVDDSVTLTIPVKAKDLIDNYEVYLGFQTTPEELERNRKAKGQ
jgi:hypothetical protein